MIGVDFGASYVDVAVIERGNLARTYSVPQKYYSHEFLSNILKSEMEQGKPIGRMGKVGITGIRAKSNLGIAKIRSKTHIGIVSKRNPILSDMRRKFKATQVGEIAAIALGAGFLTGKTRFICANLGTGTPFVFVDGKKHSHIAGTGIGGGTLEGLGKILIGASISEMEGMALKGKNSLDLTIGDLLGGGLGKLPAATTASNFGKISANGKTSNEDIALSIIGMVGETIGVMGALAAKSCGLKEIVFTGRVVDENKLIGGKIASATKLFGIRAIFPADAKYCTAIGAALSAEKNK